MDGHRSYGLVEGPVSESPCHERIASFQDPGEQGRTDWMPVDGFKSTPELQDNLVAARYGYTRRSSFG